MVDDVKVARLFPQQIEPSCRVPSPDAERVALGASAIRVLAMFVEESGALDGDDLRGVAHLMRLAADDVERQRASSDEFILHSSIPQPIDQ